MFSDEEIERYKRHLVLKEIGGEGQQRLKRARVLIVGAGGLGSPVLIYLAAAGVGTLGLVDDDTVSLDNLQRQIAHETSAVGEPKTASAASLVRRLNPHVAVETHQTRLTADNALALIEGYDIVADASDNFTTRYLLNDACYFAKRPLVAAALGPFDGQLTTFRPFETGADGNPNPNYRCLFPEPPPAGTVAPCAETGILGAVAGVMGTLQAVEVLKELTGTGESLVGRLLLYDALATRFSTMQYAWDPENPLSGRNPKFTDLDHLKN